jgi:hypothetical protein
LTLAARELGRSGAKHFMARFFGVAILMANATCVPPAILPIKYTFTSSGYVVSLCRIMSELYDSRTAPAPHGQVSGGHRIPGHRIPGRYRSHCSTSRLSVQRSVVNLRCKAAIG